VVAGLVPPPTSD